MNQDRQKGFTLIELILSMGFVSALLIAIALTIVQIGNSYTRGLTLKEVNQAGRLLSGELGRNISQTTPFDIGLSTVLIHQGTAPDYWGGRLCTGQYSYVWNYGTAINSYVSSGTDINLYDTNLTLINFVKVIDGTGLMCQSDPVSGLLPLVPYGESIELLNKGDRSLAMHDFNIKSLAEDTRTGQQLYRISFILGTNEQGLIENNKCKAPGLAGSSQRDLSYCAINEFDTVIRAGNTAE